MARTSKAFDHSKYANWIDPNVVAPYDKNAKIHTDKQIKNIVNSIKRFGWQQDVVITSDNVLVIGHGRRLAALKIGCEMPYHVIDKTADELTDETHSEDSLWSKAVSQHHIKFDETGRTDYTICLNDLNDAEEKEIYAEAMDSVMKIVFENVRDWRKHEENLRKFIDEFENVSISVGGFEDENKQGDT